MVLPPLTREFEGTVRLGAHLHDGEKDGVGTEERAAGLENVANVTGFKQSVPGGLALPEEGYVRQQVVAVCEWIEALDAATLAPV